MTTMEQGEAAKSTGATEPSVSPGVSENAQAAGVTPLSKEEVQQAVGPKGGFEPRILSLTPAPAGWKAVFEHNGAPVRRSVAAWLTLDLSDGTAPVPASVVGGVGPLNVPEMLPNFVGYEGPEDKGTINWDGVCRDGALRRAMQRVGHPKWEDMEGGGGRFSKFGNLPIMIRWTENPDKKKCHYEVMEGDRVVTAGFSEKEVVERDAYTKLLEVVSGIHKASKK